MKKDLEKSPRVNTSYQTVGNISSNENSNFVKPTIIQNQSTNYNFFSYKINLQCEPIVVTENNKSMMSLKNTELHKTAKKNCRNSSLGQESDFGIHKALHTIPSINIERESKNPSKSMRNNSPIKNSIKGSQNSILSNTLRNKDEKLLHMILEVKASLEDILPQNSRKRIDSVYDKDQCAFHKIENKKQTLPIKKESKSPRSLFSPQNQKNNIKDEFLPTPNDNSNIDTSYFRPIKNNEKRLIEQHYHSNDPKNINKISHTYEQQNFYIDNSVNKRNSAFFINKTFNLLNKMNIKRSDTSLEKHQTTDFSFDMENSSEDEILIKIPNETKQPRLIQNHINFMNSHDLLKKYQTVQNPILLEKHVHSERSHNKNQILSKPIQKPIQLKNANLPNNNKKLKKAQNSLRKNAKYSLKTISNIKKVHKK